MVRTGQIVVRCAASLGVGICVSTGYPVGIAAAIAVPMLSMHQPSRRSAYLSGFCYYIGALWPLVPAARNFFGPSGSLVDGVAAWVTSAMLLATPWLLAWTMCRAQLLWRVPLALFATLVPPLGLIGWASPLTATGFIFPGTAWIGLLTFTIVCGGLSAAVAPRVMVRKSSVLGITFLTGVLFAAYAHISYPGDPPPPIGWEGVNTSFGAVAHGPASLISEYNVAQWIQERAQSSRAQVIIFPETVVPRWTDATDLFWQQTLATLSASGKTIVVGAGLPDYRVRPRPSSAMRGSDDFAAALAILRSDATKTHLQANRFDRSSTQAGEAYRNAIVIRGALRGTFIQRIPVPLGMWRPFGNGGVPLNLSGPGVIRIGDQRAAILICHEQLLTWPVLISMLEHPTVVVAVSNEYWVERTSIPRYQSSAVRAWARLFSLPKIMAANR